MMKTFLLLACFGMLFFSAMAECKAPADDEGPLHNMLDKNNADRLLLVAFADNTINSVKGSASPTSYRQRGSYSSSVWGERVTSQIANDYVLEKVTEWPMTEIGVHCVVYQLADKTLMQSVIAKLAKDERIDVVQNMNIFKTQGHVTNDPYLKLQTNLQQMQIDSAHGKATGKDITIGMIDTGVDLEHPDLVGQISGNKNFAEDISASFSSDIHGTAVAGIMVATKDNAKGIIGVAPNAKLLALKACWPNKKDDVEAICNSFTLAEAVNTAIKAGVDILNMSLTGPDDPLLTLLLNKAIAKGIIVVAADTGMQSNQNFPASLKNVISVQAINPAALQQSITAPSDKVLTTLPHGTYDFISGSSMAAAEISGLVALLLEIKPDLDRDEIYTILQKSKTSSKDGGIAGINAFSAVTTVCETHSCAHPFINFADLNPL